MAHRKLSLLAFVLLASATDSKAIEKESKLIVISFDGFRNDYFDFYQPPNFVKFAESGVRANKGMKPVYPTKTLPNDYSIATGLYPESHGMVDNVFYDDLLQDTFNDETKNQSKWFTLTEPIWITGREQGFTTVAYFWPSSQVPIKGMWANYHETVNESVSWEQRIINVVDWFDTKHVALIAMFFEEPDDAGHKYGSFSTQVQLEVERLDQVVGQLLHRLEEKDLKDKVDIILVSDHGMANVSHKASENLILAEFMEDIDKVIETGSISPIFPKEGRALQLRDKLNAATPNVKVYLKEEIPEEFHYRNNRRIPPLLAVGNEGYRILLTESDLELTETAGTHGYNNSLVSMRSLFLASGPHFKKGYVFDEVFENVNLYPLMCHILGIQPHPNNGSLDNISHVLKDATTT